MSKNKWIIGGVLLLSIIFAGAVWWWDNADSYPAEPQRKTALPSKQTPATSGSQPSQQATAEAPAPASPVSAPIPELPAGGNLGLLTVKRAQLSQAKLDAEIEEQNARLRKAQGAILPVPITVTAKTPEADLALPELGLPAKGASAQAAPDQVVVVGVQGVNGSLSATIRSKGKLITVRTGQSFAGGVVSAISREAVSIRQGGSTRTLPFE